MTLRRRVISSIKDDEMNGFAAWTLAVSLLLPPMVAALINTLLLQPHLMVKGSRFQVDRMMKIVQIF